MSNTKNVSLTEEASRKYDNLTPSRFEQEVMSALVNKFRNTAAARNQNFELFDGLNLTEYIEESVRRFSTNIDMRESIEDWQSRVHDPITRNKVLAILGKIISALPIAQAKGRGDEDMRRGQIISNIYEYSEDIDDYEMNMVLILLEAIVKGVGIGYEGHERKEQAVRDVVSGDGDNMKVREGKKITNKLYAKVVRLEDFYPSSPGIDSIKKMPYCFWREIIPYQQFLQDYSEYDRTSLVQPHQTNIGDEDKPEYLDYISEDVGEGKVEILRYYNKDTDEYIIVVNGIWLNPLVLNGSVVISPLPWAHKELPFWDVKNELFDSVFFYGKSLPDKLKSFQDVLNVLTNMLLDQSFLTVFKPLLTNGYDAIEDDYLRPGRRTPVDTQGLPLKDSVMELDMSAPTGWHQYILEYTRKIMEESSVDQVSQGIAGVGERTTAQEIRVAAEGVATLLGLLGVFAKTGIKRKAMLRVKNIQHIWTQPDSPVERILGAGGANEFNKAFNVFKLDNAVMTTGKRGAKVIEMYKNKDDMPTKAELGARSTIYEIENGQKIEIMALPADYIRNTDVDIKLIPNPHTDSTQEAEKAIQLEKVKVYMSFFPDQVNKQELFAQTAEKLGDDPTKIMMDSDGQQPDEGAVAAQQQNPMSQLPSNNFSDNAVRGMAGGQAQLA